MSKVGWALPTNTNRNDTCGGRCPPYLTPAEIELVLGQDDRFQEIHVCGQREHRKCRLGDGGDAHHRLRVGGIACVLAAFDFHIAGVQATARDVMRPGRPKRPPASAPQTPNLADA